MTKQVLVNSGKTKFILIEWRTAQSVAEWSNYIMGCLAKYNVSGTHKFLGLYNKEKHTLDFEVEHELVESGIAMEFYHYRNYSILMNQKDKLLLKSFDNPKSSLLSLFDIDTSRAYPMKERIFENEIITSPAMFNLREQSDMHVCPNLWATIKITPKI